MKTGNRREATSTGIKAKVVGLTLCAMLFALCLPAHAQQAKKVPTIGIVSGGGDPKNPVPGIEAFRQGLRDLGYVEGKNIQVEYRYAGGKNERIPSLIAELVKRKVDLLVSPAEPAIRAAKQATKTIPIVMVILADPVASGLVDSLARPGGNITGVTRLTRDLSGKRLELLKETVPGISRVGILGVPDASGFQDYETAARELKIPLQSLQVRGPNPDLEGAFEAAVRRRVSALIPIRGSLINRYPKRIAELAIKNRLPSMCETGEYVDAGCLISYSANDAESFRRAAVYVDKILKGAKPADLPVEQPTKFELVINLKTAKQIGLTIPPEVLTRATKIIR